MTSLTNQESSELSSNKNLLTKFYLKEKKIFANKFENDFSSQISKDLEEKYYKESQIIELAPTKCHEFLSKYSKENEENFNSGISDINDFSFFSKNSGSFNDEKSFDSEDSENFDNESEEENSDKNNYEENHFNSEDSEDIDDIYFQTNENKKKEIEFIVKEKEGGYYATVSF